MSSIRIITQYVAICNCGNEYSDPFDTEYEAIRFGKVFPECSTCEEKP
jgi:hypothetical protein